MLEGNFVRVLHVVHGALGLGQVGLNEALGAVVRLAVEAEVLDAGKVVAKA